MESELLREQVQQLGNAGKTAGDQLCRGHERLDGIGLQQRGRQHRAKGKGDVYKRQVQYLFVLFVSVDYEGIYLRAKERRAKKQYRKEMEKVA